MMMMMIVKNVPAHRDSQNEILRKRLSFLGLSVFMVETLRRESEFLFIEFANDIKKVETKKKEEMMGSSGPRLIENIKVQKQGSR